MVALGLDAQVDVFGNQNDFMIADFPFEPHDGI